MTQYKRIAFLGLLVGAFLCGIWTTSSKYERRIANETVKTLQEIESIRKDHQSELNRISQEYQDDLAGLEGSTDSIINELESTGGRLRIKLKDYEKRNTELHNRCISDGYAEIDREASKRIIAITQEGDLWIKALQDTIKQMKGDK